MSLLRRNKRPHALDSNPRLPADLVARLDAFGRFEYDPPGSGIDPLGHPNAEYPLLQAAKQNPDRFLAALASATTPVGGWTSYGAMRLAWHFGLLGSEGPQRDRDAIGLAGLRFARDIGARWEQLNADEQALWRRVSGEPW